MCWRHAPPPGGAIEMEDVRELVRHDEIDPVVEKTQRRRVDRRTRIDDDAVRRKDRRVAVRNVEIVGDREFDRPAWNMELLRQAAVRALGAPAARRATSSSPGAKFMWKCVLS